MTSGSGVPSWGWGRGGGGASPVWPTFDHPTWLLLIPPLCLAAWWIARRSLAGWDLSRQTAHLLIRCVVIALLCVALAEPHARWRTDDVAVVAVVDVSDSVPGDQRRLADEFLTASLAKRPTKDRFGLVTTAREAYVQSLPGANAPRIDFGTTGSGDGSDLRKGVDLARALFPADAAGRVLLISDGNETPGSLSGAAAALSASGVPIDVASVEYDRSALVRVEDVVVPAWARDGDTITARVVMTAGRAASGRLTLLLDGEAVDLNADTPALSARVNLKPGAQVFSLPLRLPIGPIHRIEAVFEPDDRAASMPPLLRAEGVTFTSDRGRVLVLAEDASAAAPLVSSISSDNFKIEVRAASTAPYALAEWSGYDAVVLVNQPASNFSQAQQEAMLRYVHDAGGGLLVIGGPESYGAGGWIGSPLADALPVLLDPPQKRQMPLGALALIIDRSGSMGAPVSGTGMSQQLIANEAAILGVRALSRLDQVTVIAFDDGAKTVVPLTSVSDPEGIARRIRSIGPGGGTNIFPAIDAAAKELSKSPGGVKHIIILTDGQTVGDPNEGLAMAADLKRHGVTLSTVAIGDQSNDPLLVGLARTAGGRFYNVKREGSNGVLPQIFIKEAQTVRRTLIWEGPAFVPKLAYGGEAMRGVTGPLPGITGYVVTADRGGLSTVALRGPEGDPILAQWQHGLGRVTAYTSDATTRWNAAWIGWGSFVPFWEQQIKWIMRPSGDANARVSVDMRGERAKVSLDLLDAAGERVNFAAIRARIVPPQHTDVNRDEPRDVAFRQIGPGRYEADVDAVAAGTHLLSLRYDAGGGESDAAGSRSGSVRAAIIRRAGEEFRQPVPNTNLLWDLARRTNGRIYRLDPQGADLWVREHLQMPEISRAIWLLVALIAIAAFLVDVAVRRVANDIGRLRAWGVGLFVAAPVRRSDALSSLAKAKAKAAASMPRAIPSSHLPSASPGPGSVPSQSRSAVVQIASAPTPLAKVPPATKSSDVDTLERLRAAKKRSQREASDNA